MDPLLDYARTHEREMVALIKALVECETPSGDAAAIARFADVFADAVGGLARVRKIDGGAWGPHLLCEFELPACGADPLVRGRPPGRPVRGQGTARGPGGPPH